MPDSLELLRLQERKDQIGHHNGRNDKQQNVFKVQCHTFSNPRNAAAIPRKTPRLMAM
jgi:hypothetical protein